MDPQTDQNGTKNNPDAGFLRFWSVLGGGVFSTFFETGKSRPKIWKNRSKGATNPENGSGRRNARGQRRGKERLKPLRVWQGSQARNLRPRILGLGNLGLGKN
jgi:hypothetical protein